jgi:hypothetical protein
MVTRSKTGYFMPNPKYGLAGVSSVISPLPPTYRSALKDPNWYNAMLD